VIYPFVNGVDEEPTLVPYKFVIYPFVQGAEDEPISVVDKPYTGISILEPSTLRRAVPFA